MLMNLDSFLYRTIPWWVLAWYCCTEVVSGEEERFLNLNVEVFRMQDLYDMYGREDWIGVDNIEEENEVNFLFVILSNPCSHVQSCILNTHLIDIQGVLNNHNSRGN
ncbi:Uncharacterized protein Adt_14804 [Abeliophyllum distichum]|uniref:Uncharacterized protein n=1 Tax=Abeliophyllum distichum TaxID=126358 RepID=A0ABD1U0P7_9LAMI